MKKTYNTTVAQIIYCSTRKKTEIINSLCNSFLSENQKLNKGNNRIKHEFTKLTASIKCNKIKLVEISVIATENK